MTLFGVSYPIVLLYLGRLLMVARTGGYYGADFKGGRGVTQGDPLSPIILNMVVDTVVMVEGAEEWGEHEHEGRHQNNLF